MKKKILSVLMVFMLLISVMPCVYAEENVAENSVELCAASITSGDYEYTVNNDGVTATITYHYGSATEITIPSILDGYSVTSIGDYAFAGCDILTSITIPDSVTSIGNWAFYYCDSLTNITIPNSVTSIGEGAFDHCQSLTNITIPNCATSIGDRAFYYCESLTNITIPNSVTSIGNAAFIGCDSLTEINVSENNTAYTSVDGVLFNKNRTKLVKYPVGKTDDTYEIPNSVTSIGEVAFYNCKSLTSVTIPSSVTSIGDEAFAYCKSLTSIMIPNSVTSIGDDAFSDCKSLTSITIPNSVTSIGEWAFEYCQSLTSVTIGNSVTSIGDGAFRGCQSLTSITIPNSVTSIGDYAFNECDSLTEINVSENNTAYTSVDGVLFNKNRTELAAYPVGKTDDTYEIPSGVTSIEAFAFNICTSLTSITIPNSVISIGEWAFSDCRSLTNVYYAGSKKNWNSISIGDFNYHLKNANIHYNFTQIKHDLSISEVISVEYSESTNQVAVPVSIALDSDKEEKFSVKAFVVSYKNDVVTGVTTRDIEVDAQNSYNEDVIIDSLPEKPDYIRIFAFDGKNGVSPLSNSALITVQ